MHPFGRKASPFGCTASLAGRKATLAVSLVLALCFVQGAAFAQAYKVINLVSNQPGKALHQDPTLINAWGIAFSSTGPIWINEAGSGFSTVYNGKGVSQQFAVSVPSFNGSGTGSPAGLVFNGTNDFIVSGTGVSGPAFFLFGTLDGTISGWNPSANASAAIIAVNNWSAGASYTGLAVSQDTPGGTTNFLYAADNANGKVDIYDGGFNFVGNLSDPSIPAGFAPFGVQDINNQVYVTYAATNGGVGGFVDIYSEEGQLVKRFTSGIGLNQPWGVALAPANFGPFSHALLISNNVPNGTIAAFDANSGKFLGKLKDSSGKPIFIDQLWGIAFGAGNSNSGNTNQLFFAAGPNNFTNGLFGAISFRPSARSKR